MNKRTVHSAPARHSLGEGGFFSLRVLIGLLIALTGAILALLGFGTLAVPTASIAQTQTSYTATNSIDPLIPAAFDCSKIHELGIDKQENLRARAIMTLCGLSEGGIPFHGSGASKLVQKLMAPVLYGGLDVDLITGPETYPNVTQSTTFSWANPDTNDSVVAYNDSRGLSANPINLSGASVSTDGGTTFTRLTRVNGQSPFDNTYGAPVVLFSKRSQTWYTVWLDAGCGGQGLGGYKSSTPWDPNSWTHYCVHPGSQDDRESGWVDNNSSSAHYGNIYISWNNFSVGGGALFVTISTDDGNSWTPHQITSGFIRDVQVTGDLVTGDVYIAGMDEGGGGFPHNDMNLFFRSTDGGNTWTNTYIGPGFPGPGVVACSTNPYFACMFPDNGGYWRHEGGGEPAAINGIVHYVYDQHGTGSDPADVYYVRSTDRGVTFSAPVKLNTDTTTRPNWEPNLSISPSGTLFAVWYDARESTSCTYGDPTVPCYRMWARKSNDGGLTWLPDDTFSDVVSPLPAPDPGDYDYGSATVTKHLSSWCDGRVAINGISQPDTFFDSEPSVASTPTPTPTATPTTTPRPTPTPRITPSPRSRPTPPPRP